MDEEEKIISALKAGPLFFNSDSKCDKEFKFVATFINDDSISYQEIAKSIEKKIGEPFYGRIKEINANASSESFYKTLICSFSYGTIDDAITHPTA